MPNPLAREGENDYGPEINGWRRDSKRLDWLLALSQNTDFEVDGQIVTDLDRAKIDRYMAEEKK